MKMIHTMTWLNVRDRCQESAVTIDDAIEFLKILKDLNLRC